jgi:signal recognition particle subunit SRP54
MFDNLSEKILSSLKKVRGQSKITEGNIEETLKEIRLSLLEADVNFKVVKNFIDRVKTKAIGQQVLQSITAGQQFVKIVHDELKFTLGNEAVDINLREKPAVIFLVGLQGAGKTTSAAKLALFIRQKFSKKVGLVPCDIYRPAAIDQLQTLGKQNNFPVYPTQVGDKPESILQNAKKWATEQMLDAVIVDTAGRLQIDDELMQELSAIKNIWNPHEILLVADAMLGQQSVNVAEGFHKRLQLTGLVLTKVDGDARGGAALSIREVTGIPIKFLGVGEKVSALEVFHPDRLASRILDMGDVLTLVEKAQEVMDEKTVRDQTQKMLKNQFTIEDFLQQIQTLKKMGGFESMMKFLPGMGELSKQMKSMAPPDAEIKKIEAIIRSMTPKERKDPRILNASRRERIAKGSGTQVQDINRFVKQFEQSQKMMSGLMKGMGRGGFKMPF